MVKKLSFFLMVFLIAGIALAQEEDKAEKERQKKEQKAQEKELKELQETQEIRNEMQEEIDALGLEFLRSKYNDPFLEDYINEMGQSLVPQEVPPGVLFSFRVLEDYRPNALALPDGRIYVTTGLLVFVDNEAQLATALGHEIGHVMEQHAVKAFRDAKSFKKAVLPGILGAIGGAAIGRAVGGKEGAVIGAAVGAAAGVAVTVLAANKYGRKQEDEADQIGTSLSLKRDYDARQGVALFQKLAETFGENDPLTDLLWANHPRNRDRVKTINALLDGGLSTSYNQKRLAGELTLGSGQMKLYASRMIRETAIKWMQERDRYDLAKKQLESIIDLRANDPKTLWALGRVYKLVGRTPEEKARALELFQRAVQLDERNMYPFIHRDLGLIQASRLGTEGMAPAVESLKKYIVGHMDKYGRYPSDIEDMYDYMLAFGDAKWTAPKVDSVIVEQKPAPPPGAPAAAPTGKTGAAPVDQLKPPPKKKPSGPTSD